MPGFLVLDPGLSRALALLLGSGLLALSMAGLARRFSWPALVALLLAVSALAFAVLG